MRRCLVLLLIAIPAFAQQPFDKLANDVMTAWRFPGMAVAIVQDDHVIYARGFGVKEIGKSDPVTIDTLFGIGSTTKAFTSTSMAMLVDEKKLDWDDPVRQHLDYFHIDDPCSDSLVTLRDLVSHRTGLSRHDELWDNSPWTRSEILHRIAYVKPNKPIRTAYQYNNIMFMAAGDVVASASKMSWDDFVRTRIFQPLGMTHSNSLWADWLASDHATGHRYTHDTVVIQPAVDDSNIGPAGAIKSSARDMAQWLRFQLADGVIDGKRLVSEDALNETKSPQMALRIDKQSREVNPFVHVQSYAMGWVVQDYRGELMIAHAGALNGFRAQVVLLPERHIGVVVLTNLGRGSGLSALRNGILDAMLQAKPARDWNAVYLANEKRSDDADAKAKAERAAKRIPDTKPSRDLASYAGTYHDEAYGDATVTLENGALVLHWSRMTVPLTHYHFDTFYATSEADDIDEQVQFQLGADGSVKSMTVFGEEFAKK